MARPLRLEFPGAVYHVTARGDRREDIFLDEADRVAFLGLLEKVCERFNWRIHAYCLMTNHYHLVIETPDGNLSSGMRQLNGVYTQRFNRRHRRVGHVLQGRYRAILVDKDAYLLELARYVVLNPVRAAMVTTAGQWPWSSYRATIGRKDCPPWLEVDTILGCFSKRRQSARAKYIAFVRQGKNAPSIWDNLTQQIYLGDERFVMRAQERMGAAAEKLEIPRVQQRPPAKPLTHYARRYSDEKQAMAKAYETGRYTLKEIADYFGVHYSTVSRAVARYAG